MKENGSHTGRATRFHTQLREGVRVSSKRWKVAVAAAGPFRNELALTQQVRKKRTPFWCRFAPRIAKTGSGQTT
jgi:hypothetical protein